MHAYLHMLHDYFYFTISDRKGSKIKEINMNNKTARNAKLN